MPDFFDVVSSQRACRAFAERDVPDELVTKILAAATHAPSAENLQPWVFIVVRDPALRAGLGELTKRAWDGGGRAYSESRLKPRMFEEVDRGAQGGVSAAPVLIAVCGDTRETMPQTVSSSILPAVQNLLLAATASGLGSALTTLPTLFADELRQLLGLPDHLVPMAVVPIGWPARPLGPPRRRPVTEVAHRDRYGQKWTQ